MKNRNSGNFTWIENNSDPSLPVVLLIHGNSLGANTYKDQLSADCFKGYRLIALDLPGCGNAICFDQAPDGYRVPDHVLHLVEFVRKHASNTIYLVGHSLGGHIGIALLEHLPSVKKLFIFGTPPLSIPYPVDHAFLPSEEVSFFFNPDMNELNADRLSSFLFHQSIEEKRVVVKDLILKCDGHFRTGVGLSVAEGKVKDELEAIRKSSSEVAIAIGEYDKTINQGYVRPIAEKLGWNNQLLVIKNTGHMSNMESPEEFNSMLLSFFKA